MSNDKAGKALHLFEAFGIELEYMIVDRDSLKVKSIADELFKSVTGSYNGDFENGIVTWSNELTSHLIEIKCTKPESNLDQLGKAFHDNVKQINEKLGQWNAMLLPTAAHPFMDPATETRLWPHDKGDVYSIYDKMFNCKGHGWANLQSTHLNLPFAGDEEFGRLHAAIRIIMPLLPALCASSTILDGKVTDHLDARMYYYKSNQQAIPSITGKVVPEAVFSEAEYEKQIYRQIAKDIEPWNGDGILDPVWVNSRGAMARFDRGSIEIRVMDIQECPAMDMAIQGFVIDLLKRLVSAAYDQQKAMDTGMLAGMLDDTAMNGMDTVIDYDEWLAIFNLKAPCTAGDVLRHLSNKNKNIEFILREGNLSMRMRKALKRNSLLDVYATLAGCLQNNAVFQP